MSVFRLHEIAPLLGKDVRSIRRWCLSGVIPCASQSTGGHWRLEGETRSQVAKIVSESIAGKIKTRKRIRDYNGKIVSPGKIARSRDRFTYSKWRRLAILTTCAEILDTRIEDVDVIERHGIKKVAKHLGVSEKSLMPESVFESDDWKSPDKVVIALAWLMSRPEEVLKSGAGIAEFFGMSRSSLYRHLGHEMKTARELARRSQKREREAKREFAKAKKTLTTDYDKKEEP